GRHCRCHRVRPPSATVPVFRPPVPGRSSCASPRRFPAPPQPASHAAPCVRVHGRSADDSRARSTPWNDRSGWPAHSRRRVFPAGRYAGRVEWTWFSVVRRLQCLPPSLSDPLQRQNDPTGEPLGFSPCHNWKVTDHGQAMKLPLPPVFIAAVLLLVVGLPVAYLAWPAPTPPPVSL